MKFAKVLQLAKQLVERHDQSILFNGDSVFIESLYDTIYDYEQCDELFNKTRDQAELMTCINATLRATCNNELCPTPHDSVKIESLRKRINEYEATTLKGNKVKTNQ